MSPRHRNRWLWSSIALLVLVGAVLAVRSGVVSVPGKRAASAGGLAARGALAGYNVLLVTLDTARADRLGCYGYKAIATPTLDRLAAEGVLFSRATAVTPITAPSHASILTGLYPRRHGVRSNGFYQLDDEHVTLAEVLHASGYQTGAILAAFVLDSRFGMDQGFEYYDDELGSADTADPLLYAERQAAQVTDAALAWLDQRSQKPFLLWAHYFDPHAAYTPPSPYREHYASNPYDGEIAYVDAELGRLLAGLERLGCRDNTIVVVIGDHGESLHQHDEATHGYLLYEETMRVPFILQCGDRLGGGSERSERVSQVDLVPTVLALLGIDAPAGIDGVDLARPNSEARVCYGETYHGKMEYGWAALFSIYDDDLKYVHGPHPELYDLERDPQELTSLYEQQPDRAAELHERLAAWFDTELGSGAVPSPSKQLSETEMARLASLGYVFSDPSGSPKNTTEHDPRQMMRVLSEVNRVVFGKPPDQRGEQVISELKGILQRHPDLVPGYRYLGTLQRANGDLASAIAAFERAVRLHPMSPDLHLMLAETRMLHGQTQPAIEGLRALLGTFPHYEEAHLMLGRLLLADEALDDALEHLRIALELRPDLHGCPDTLLRAYDKAGRAPELEPILDAALAASPAAPEVRLTKATLLYRQQKHAEAEAVLREGLRLAPGNPKAVDNLVRFLIAKPNEGDNLAEATALLEGLPQHLRQSDPGLLLSQSQVHGLYGRLDEALAACRDAIAVAERTRKRSVLSQARQYLERLEQARSQRGAGLR